MALPWEKNWGAEEPAPLPKAEAKKPWLRDWAEKTFSKSPQKPQEAPVSTSKPLGDGLTLDTVFEGLKQAESKGLHINAKTGGLTTSPAGAEGITQLMPKTAAKPGYGIEGVKDKSEKEYLRVGKEYLAAMHKKYGDWEMALAAYNAGVGNVDKAKGKAERFGGDWKDYLPKKEETLPYIDRVLGRGKKTSALSTPKDKFYEGTSGEQMLKNIKGTAYDIASMTPGVGDAMSLVEAVKSFKNKEYAEAGLNALGVLPFVPSAAGIIRSKPYFHGTRKEFEKHDNGLIFLTEQPDTAAHYASGAGGQRGGAKTAFYKDSDSGAVFEQRGDELVQVTGKEKGRKLPADVDELQDMGIYPTEDWDKVAQGANIRRYYVDTEKTLDLHHKGYDRGGKAINEGAKILSTLDPKKDRWASQIVEKAKKGEFDWSTTKYPEAQKAWKEILIPQLQAKGYDSIQYWDDMHPTLAVFEDKQLMSSLPKKLETKSKVAQEEAINNLIPMLEKEGKIDEANKLRSMLPSAEKPSAVSPSVSWGSQHPKYEEEISKVFKSINSSNSKDFKDYKLVHVLEDARDVDGQQAIMAFDKKGNVVGTLSYVRAEGFHPDVWVEKANQRQKIATQMYDMARERGWKLSGDKGAVRTEDGMAFRKSYNEGKK